MSGIMAATIGSYTSPQVETGSFLLGTTSAYLSTTVATAVANSAATYEFWLYVISTPGNAVVLNTRPNGNTFGSGLLLFLNGGLYRLTGNVANPTLGTVTLGTWNHIAITLPTGNINKTARLCVNGVSAGTAIIDVSLTSTNLYIGGIVYGSVLGYVSNFRYVLGVEVYTGTFTPPTSPLTATQSAGTNISAITAGQTQLLLNTATEATVFTDSSGYARTVTDPVGGVIFSASSPFS
jgi:hypothetical protein